MDEKAQRFSEECGPYAGMVYRHCLHMLSRPEEAEDAAQESMLRAFRAYDGYRGEGTATWLYRIAHNTCLDILRSARWKRETLPYDGLPETVDPSPTPEDVYQKRSRQEQLWQAVEQLPTDQQVILSLYYGENQSYEALSRLLKLPEGTVKSRLSRAKENLRKVLGQGDAKF